MDLIQEWKHKKSHSKKRLKRLMSQLQRQKGKPLDRWANELHDSTFKKIDCLDCANCCTSIPPIVNTSDAARLAKHLRLKVSIFQNKYLHQDDDGDWVMNTTPCPFLEADNKCQVYDFRPKACREYPHTDASEFSRNMHLHQQNAIYCPAVYHILIEMTKGIGMK